MSNDTTTDAAPEMTKSEKKALFDTRLEATAQLQAVKDEVAAAEQAVSDANAAIHQNVGSGPFQYRGEKFRLVSRDGRVFARSLGEPEIEKIG